MTSTSVATNGADALAGQGHLHRMRRRHRSQQPMQAADGRDRTDACFRQAELRSGRRDAPELETRCRPLLNAANDSYRVDERYGNEVLSS